MEFRFERKARYNVLFKFGHGRYLDTWSILHVLSGFVLGLLILLFGFDWWIGLSVILIMLFLYEIFEAFNGIAEDVENSLSDIACGGFGTLLAYIFSSFFLPILIPTILISLFLAFLILFIGWRSYLSRRFARSHNLDPKNRLSYRGPAAQRSIILFFGSALVFIPMPIFAATDFKLAITWFAFVCLVYLFVTGYLHVK